MNKNLIDTLSQLQSITNTVILKYPISILTSESRDIYLHLDCKELDETPFPTIGLNDNMSNFLQLFKLFNEDRNVSYEGDTIKITSGDITSSYISDNIALMESFDISPDQFDRTEQVPTVCSFDLDVEDIKKLKSASGVFKDLSEIIIKSIDGDITMSLGATNKFNARDNSYSIKKTVKTEKDFEVKLPVENLKKLPESNYILEVKYNEAKDSYRLYLKNKSLNGLKIILSVIK